MKELETRKNAVLELTKPELVLIKEALNLLYDKSYDAKLGPKRLDTQLIGDLCDAISGVLAGVSKP
jgi:hypothetical protein